jgi:TRAP transporter 4TM/12TM fusion protein
MTPTPGPTTPTATTPTTGKGGAHTLVAAAVRYLGIGLAVLAILFNSGALGAVGIFIPPVQYRAIALVVLLVLVYATTTTTRNQGSRRWYDYVLLVPGLAGGGYVALFYEQYIVPYSLFGFLDPVGVVLAIGLCISLLEALRRLTGIVLPVITLVLVLATYFQAYLPGLLRGTGFTIERLTYALYVGSGGIFGTPFAIAATIIITFLIFAALLQLAGGGRWFADLANSVTGWARGGPAKAAVVSSAFMGSISGSPSGNTATSGAFTIPLMKRTGYRASFAGAVEAVASTGGMVLPPVMGAVAFIMAELLAIPYADVAKAALMPAIIYFAFVLISVHFRACADDLEGMDRAVLPPFVRTLVSGWRYLLPIAVLIYALLGARMDPEVAGMLALPALVVCSFFTRDRSLWLTPRNILDGFVDAMKGWRIVAVVTASVGMFIGALNLSGVGVKVSSYIVEVGGGNLLLTLLLVGLASFILGAGLEIVPLYLTLVVLTAPALVELGLTGTQAHLYVIFWGLASFITPPVCTAVYVACSISGAGVWPTGGQALRLGLPIFFIPVAFALNPALMLEGDPTSVISTIVITLLAGTVVAAGTQGYLLWHLSAPQRVVLIVAGLLPLSMVPALMGVSAGLVVLVLVWWRAGLPGHRAGVKENDLRRDAHVRVP